MNFHIDPSPASRRKQRKRRTKRLAVCAMLASLSVVILYCGALLEVFELCTVALASFLIVPVVIEYGRAYPWAVYLTAALLSLLLLPQKVPGVVYLLFGFYPIAKAKFERFPRLICIVCKQILFIITEAAVIVASNFLIGAEDMPPWYNVLLAVLGFVTLNLYDIALSRLIVLYVKKYRVRIGRLMN